MAINIDYDVVNLSVIVDMGVFMHSNASLSVPFVRTSFAARSFSVAAPKIWNSLPPAVRMCTGPNTFRGYRKTHYCQQAFQPK